MCTGPALSRFRGEFLQWVALQRCLLLASLKQNCRGYLAAKAADRLARVSGNKLDGRDEQRPRPNRFQLMLEKSLLSNPGLEFTARGLLAPHQALPMGPVGLVSPAKNVSAAAFLHGNKDGRRKVLHQPRDAAELGCGSSRSAIHKNEASLSPC